MIDTSFKIFDPNFRTDSEGSFEEVWSRPVLDGSGAKLERILETDEESHTIQRRSKIPTTTKLQHIYIGSKSKFFRAGPDGKFEEVWFRPVQNSSEAKPEAKFNLEEDNQKVQRRSRFPMFPTFHRFTISSSTTKSKFFRVDPDGTSKEITPPPNPITLEAKLDARLEKRRAKLERKRKALLKIETS